MPGERITRDLEGRNEYKTDRLSAETPSDWAKENNESGQIRNNRAFIGVLRERGFQVLPGSQNKHFVHGLGAEDEEAETWVN